LPTPIPGEFEAFAPIEAAKHTAVATKGDLHFLQAWKALPVGEQEKVIGRSKSDDIELPDGVKPSNAHSALTNVDDDFRIVRNNMPFGNVSNHEMEAYFIAYASSFATVKKMLTNIFVGVPKGNYDRILDFSTPKQALCFLYLLLKCWIALVAKQATLTIQKALSFVVRNNNFIYYADDHHG